MIKHAIKLKQGDILFNEDDVSKSMYIIENGNIAITKMKSGSVVILAEFKSGDLIGEMSFFDNSPRSAGAVITSLTASIIEIPFSSLKQHYEKIPTEIKTLIKTINHNLRTANERILRLEKTIKNLKSS